MNIGALGEWDADAQLHFIPTLEFGLPQASVFDDEEAMKLVRRWHEGRLALGDPQVVPVSSITASIQGVIRRDVLQFYLDTTERTFDANASSWGAQGPLAAELRDGRTVLIDGNHRWAAAWVRADEAFRVQILRYASEGLSP